MSIRVRCIGFTKLSMTLTVTMSGRVCRCLIDTALLTLTNRIVQRALSQERLNDYQSRSVLVVTWHNVTTGQYSSDVGYRQSVN